MQRETLKPPHPNELLDSPHNQFLRTLVSPESIWYYIGDYRAYESNDLVLGRCQIGETRLLYGLVFPSLFGGRGTGCGMGLAGVFTPICFCG